MRIPSCLFLAYPLGGRLSRNKREGFCLATADVLGCTLVQWGDELLAILLFDQSTQRAIRWATGDYQARGVAFSFEAPIRPQDVAWIQHRTAKSAQEQASRVKRRAEVFTPAWICKQMTDAVDAEWFEAAPGQLQGDFWEEEALLTPLVLRPGRRWQDYLRERRLEITCGEAPYLTARYNVTSGQRLNWERRYGLLDRKLRLLPKCLNRQAWMKWVEIAYQSIYGYEYQGDSLYLARSNLLATFVDAYTLRWKEAPPAGALRRIAEILSWNLWQMDGLTGGPPGGVSPSSDDLFAASRTFPHTVRSSIRNWPLTRNDVHEVTTMAFEEMKFDVIIGNPPYQAETVGDNETFAPPIYHDFMESAYKRADRVLLIHPARFLFNAGKTPKAWNEKVLNDPHVKVVYYEAKSANVFPGTDIKGGVVITYRDTAKDFGKIEVFTPWQELNSIQRKVFVSSGFRSLKDVVYTQTRFDLEALYRDYPEYRTVLGSGGKDRRFRNNIFEKVALFTEKPKAKDDIAVYGLIKNKRVWRYIPRKYVDEGHVNLNKWKVFVPRANGSGALGEVLSTPLIGEPLIGVTQTFISIGCFETRTEAEACLKYIKSKFARVMLGVLKITQDNDRGVWRYVPLQDFGAGSDIDWSGSVASVDAQLYRKYGLSAEEVAFIESRVKEMA